MHDSGTLVALPIGEREIVLVRKFDAPRDRVFAALTTAESLLRWFAPHGWTMDTCAVDLREGGKWRFVLSGPGGARLGMSGTYREINAPERLVSTEAFDEFPGYSVATTVLVEGAGKTTLTNTIVYASQQIRDAVIDSGMEHGAAESYDNLARLLTASA